LYKIVAVLFFIYYLFVLLSIFSIIIDMFYQMSERGKIAGAEIEKKKQTIALKQKTIDILPTAESSIAELQVDNC